MILNYDHGKVLRICKIDQKFLFERSNSNILRIPNKHCYNINEKFNEKYN